MGLEGCCLHIWHQVEEPFLIFPSGSWVMGAGGRVILICLLRYQWAHRPVSTACMFTNLLVYNKSITEWLGVGIIKDQSHNLHNPSFSKSTQINAQRTSEQHACCKKGVLKKKKKRKKKVVLQVLQLLNLSSQNTTPQLSLHRNLEIPLKTVISKQLKACSLEEETELTGVAQI